MSKIAGEIKIDKTPIKVIKLTEHLKKNNERTSVRLLIGHNLELGLGSDSFVVDVGVENLDDLIDELSNARSWINGSGRGW